MVVKDQERMKSGVALSPAGNLNAIRSSKGWSHFFIATGRIVRHGSRRTILSKKESPDCGSGPKFTSCGRMGDVTSSLRYQTQAHLISDRRFAK
jgi:hypothetical protein